ncbi:MAG: acyl-CoA dehydrogenase family protein [Geminicoccaceae bacterium]
MLPAPAHSRWDNELAGDILEAFSAFAEGVVAPLDEIGDREGARLENGRVRMPEGFAAAYAQLAEMGWQGLSAPEVHGGMEQGPLVAAMVSEVFSGANHAMQMVCNLVPGAVRTLLRFGSPSQQSTWIPRLAAGEVLSTMCLSEPGAGSDLSRIRTKAVRTADDGWRIDGEKIFISGGDQDLSDDILHLVLARTGKPEDGIRGLSLFLASRSGAGGAIRVARIEEKLGLHASPTCHMVFRQRAGGAGRPRGRRARSDVHTDEPCPPRRGPAGCRPCDARARHRLGPCRRAGAGRRPDGSDAVLANHPDVRRMLDEQRILSLGARAMVHVALVESERADDTALADFLTPLCKVFCTEAGIRSADLGIQILGGYGYLNEYRVAQTWRDARITSIYEGANGIHELATATRNLRLRDGAGPDAFEALVERLGGDPRVAPALARWREARAFMLASSEPATHAHAFCGLACDLFERAVFAHGRCDIRRRNREALRKGSRPPAPARSFIVVHQASGDGQGGLPVSGRPGE